ncbi:hypothetical protein [Streptomyces luteogriseus]|uniref:hypothetical protein n=1 Tax=Streptomyces luteogriseus TaxID=68233 RepID=UPI003720489D
MANNQTPLPEGEGDIITQAEAYEMAGVSRAVMRGCIDRGELRVADRLGSRGSVRLWRSDVARLMVEKKWPGAAVGRPISEQSNGTACRECAAVRSENKALQEAHARDAETIQMLRDAFDVVTRRR